MRGRHLRRGRLSLRLLTAPNLGYTSPMEALQTRYTTYAEYLAAEETSVERHEWFNGHVFAMAGGTEEHALLGAAVLGELRNALRGRPCRPLSSDMRIRPLGSDVACYPDAVVVCGKRIPHPEDRHTVSNPTVIVEVLSPSTEVFDRTEKFENYMTMASLRDYVLVSTGRNHIDHYAWVEDGAWMLRSHGPGATFRLTGCDVELSVDAIYEGVEAAREADRDGIPEPGPVTGRRPVSR